MHALREEHGALRGKCWASFCPDVSRSPPSPAPPRPFPVLGEEASGIQRCWARCGVQGGPLGVSPLRTSCPGAAEVGRTLRKDGPRWTL